MTNKKTLYRKLATIAGEIERVDKDGKNKHFNYTYPTPSAVMRALKPLLAEHSIAIIPSVTDIQQFETAKNTRTCIKTVYTIVDGESGEEFTATWAGEAQDQADKGIAKAETIALRTFLLQLFQMPAEDADIDPDHSKHASYSEPREQPRQRSRNGKKAPPAEQPESEQQQTVTISGKPVGELRFNKDGKAYYKGKMNGQQILAEDDIAVSIDEVSDDALISITLEGASRERGKYGLCFCVSRIVNINQARDDEDIAHIAAEIEKEEAAAA